MKNFEIKITKKELLKELNNDMVHSYYYLVHVRIYNQEHTKYKKARFVVWFEAMDIQEYYDIDWYTKDDVMNYLEELIYSQFICWIKSYEDTKEFYELCNDSIISYNNTNEK